MQFRLGCALVLALATILVPGGDAAAENADAPAAKPNIVWIVLDALRAENLSCYGYHRETSPRMDALAAKGVVFEQAYAQTHSTRLSVPSYLTGRYFPVQVLNFGTWQELWRTAPPGELFLPEIAEENGYRTMLYSATPWIYRGSRLWNMFDETRYLGGAGSVEVANETLLERLEETGDKPFFLYMHLVETHFPHKVEHLQPGHTQWVDLDHPRVSAMAAQLDAADKTFSEKERELLVGLYDGSIHYEDTHVGRLVERFKELGLYDSTVFIISADHGEALAENGKFVGHLAGWMYEQVIRVPLIMFGAGIPEGKRVANRVELVDIVPTLIDLCDLETKAEPHGKSLTQAFDSSGPLHEHIFGKYAPPWNDEVVTLSLMSDEYFVEWNPSRKTEKVWTMPYRIERQVPAEEADAKAAGVTVRNKLKNRFLPKWDAYQATPRTSPMVFIEQLHPKKCVTPNAFAVARPAKADWTDDKWSLSADYLAVCPWKEEAPPITFKFDVPNGKYKVELYAGHSAKMPPDDRPASAFRYSAQGEPPREFVMTSRPQRNVNWHTYVTLGEYDVDSEIFAITLSPGADDYWAIARRLKFTPLSIQEEAQVDDGEIDEQLRALGYLN